jgi:hypothetical protein
LEISTLAVFEVDGGKGHVVDLYHRVQMLNFDDVVVSPL